MANNQSDFEIPHRHDPQTVTKRPPNNSEPQTPMILKGVKKDIRKDLVETTNEQLEKQPPVDAIPSVPQIALKLVRQSNKDTKDMN